MIARQKLQLLKEKFGAALHRADIPADNRLVVYIEAAAVKAGLGAGKDPVGIVKQVG